MWIPDHLNCPLRNLYVGQESSVKIGHGTVVWFKIGKEVQQGYILSCFLFKFYAEYIKRNARLDESQAGIKVAGRRINNLRYADDTTVMAEVEEELKSLLMRVKEESKKAGLKLNIKIMVSGPITSKQTEVEAVTSFFFLGSKFIVDVTIVMKWKDACCLEGELWQI